MFDNGCEGGGAKKCVGYLVEGIGHQDCGDKMTLRSDTKGGGRG